MQKKVSSNNYKPGLDIDYVKKKFRLKNVIKLASNENPVGPSPKARIIYRKEINNINRYPDGKCIKLKEQLTKNIGKRYIRSENIIIGNGSSEILELIARTYLNSKSEVIFSKHSFIVYQLISNALNAKIVESNLITSEDNDFMVSDLDDMYRKISKKTKLIFIANPANPTGALIKSKKLDNFLKKIPKTIKVVIDEAYFEYACHRNHTTALNYINKYDNVLITRSFSKIYALAGVRIGYGLANQNIIDELNEKRQPFNVNQVAQSMAIESLKDKNFLRKSLIDYEKNRLYLFQELDKLNLKYINSYANFITINFGSKTKKIFESLLSSGVILRPLENYGMNGYLRMTIGTTNECNKFIKCLKMII